MALDDWNRQRFRQTADDSRKNKKELWRALARSYQIQEGGSLHNAEIQLRLEGERRFEAQLKTSKIVPAVQTQVYGAVAKGDYAAARHHIEQLQFSGGDRFFRDELSKERDYLKGWMAKEALRSATARANANDFGGAIVHYDAAISSLSSKSSKTKADEQQLASAAEEKRKAGFRVASAPVQSADPALPQQLGIARNFFGQQANPTNPDLKEPLAGPAEAGRAASNVASVQAGAVQQGQGSGTAWDGRSGVAASGGAIVKFEKTPDAAPVAPIGVPAGAQHQPIPLGIAANPPAANVVISPAASGASASRPQPPAQTITNIAPAPVAPAGSAASSSPTPTTAPGNAPAASQQGSVALVVPPGGSANAPAGNAQAGHSASAVRPVPPPGSSSNKIAALPQVTDDDLKRLYPDPAVQAPKDGDLTLLFQDGASRQRVGEPNPGRRYINPLSEPEKYRESLLKDFQNFPEFSTSIEKILKSMDAEQRKHFDAAADKINGRQDEALDRINKKYNADFKSRLDELMRSTGAASEGELLRRAFSDRAFAARINEMEAAIRRERESAEAEIRRRTFVELLKTFETYNDPVAWELERKRTAR